MRLSLHWRFIKFDYLAWPSINNVWGCFVDLRSLRHIAFCICLWILLHVLSLCRPIPTDLIRHLLLFCLPNEWLRTHGPYISHHWIARLLVWTRSSVLKGLLPCSHSTTCCLILDHFGWICAHDRFFGFRGWALSTASISFGCIRWVGEDSNTLFFHDAPIDFLCWVVLFLLGWSWSAHLYVFTLGHFSGRVASLSLI